MNHNTHKHTMKQNTRQRTQQLNRSGASAETVIKIALVFIIFVIVLAAVTGLVGKLFG
jgi:hypothetical protein